MSSTERDELPAAVAEVAACTVTAVHRRDHHHPLAGQACHPHTVEVVLLGQRAVTVCHDCGTDSGFVPQRLAERLADGHRGQTLVDSVSLPRPASD